MANSFLTIVEVPMYVGGFFGRMTDLPATSDYGLGQSESQLAGMSLSGRRIWAKMRARCVPGWETRYSPLLAIFDGD